MKSQQGYKNPTPRQFANDLLAVKSFERGEGRVHHKPIEVYLQVASACNLDCYMCYEHLRPTKFRRGRGLRSMPPDLFAKIERDILPHSTKITFGVGGEPMLCEHLLDYIQRSYALRQHVHLMTNGTRITNDAVAEVLARCLTSMEISIDAATKETYERIRLGSKWEGIQANLERLNRFRFQSEPKERTHLSLCFVMMKSNVHELPLFVDFAKKMRADRISGWHVIPVTDEGRREALIDDQERCDHYLALAKARAAELGIEADLVKPFKPDGAVFAPALAGTRQAAIERMARLDDGETIAKAIAAVAPSAEDLAIGHDSPVIPELRAGISPAATLPRGALEAMGKAPETPEGNGANGANGNAEHAGHEHHDHSATPVDANGVLAPIDFVAIPDPPDAAEAAIALQDYLARPKGARLHCASPYTGVFIFFDGRVFPCCHPHAHTKLPMGNLIKQEFDEIWNGRAYRNLRAGLKQGDPPPICQRCSIVHGPSANMEQAGPDEGEGADLASYYGALDLDPSDPTEENALLARIGIERGTQRDALAGHVRNVERELAPLREQAQAVEQSLVQLHRHADELQHERDELVGHAKNLQSEIGPLREHSKTIEDLLLKLHRHAAEIEHERDALVGHARNLESELRPLREHTKTIEETLLKLHRHSKELEHERDALVGHSRTLEAEREALYGHVKDLNHIMRKSYSMLLYRLRCRVGKALGIGQKPKPKG